MEAFPFETSGIRPARSTEYTILAELGRRAYRQHFTHLWTPAGMDRYLDQAYTADFFASALQSEEIKIWLAESGGRPCGYLMYHRRKALPGRADEGGCIHRIYLLAGCGGQGLGSRLMACVLRQAQQDGVPYVWLESMQSSEQSIRFYQKHGFEIYGETAFTQMQMRTPELARMWWMYRAMG